MASDAEFVHLHVHSQYSMLDSALRIPDLVERAKRFRMPAVALTDHHNMFGAARFYKACDKAGVKPILGSEVNICADRTDPSRREAHHLVLLAASQEGLRNLVRLVSLGWVEGMSGERPRIDFALLSEHRRGLVGLSACLGGYAAQQILQLGEQAGREALGKLRDCLEPGAFYVEIQDHGFDEQKALNQILIALADDMELPLLASNDVHFLERRHAYAQTVLHCIAEGCTLREMEQSHHGSSEMYFKSPSEMRSVFGRKSRLLSRTMEVAERCAGMATPLAEKPALPRFPVPEGMDDKSYFRELAEQGLQERFNEFVASGKKADIDLYRDRLQMECDVICSMGYEGYYLIVQDFINWARKRGIPVGPGRGSGAGSLVAYTMRITDLDPIPYGLLFERFLNPERVSMPDFDLDFCMERRDEVIRYVRNKYGNTSVGQIATFHLLKSRSVVRDAGRVMGMAPAEAGRIAALVPEPVQGKSVPVAEALVKEPRLKSLYDENEQVRDLLDTAISLEDLTRHAGMHAAGVVISDGDLWDHVPVFCPEPGLYVTQYPKDDVEAAGLVKFDFLGLKTLTVLDIAVRLINRRPDRAEEPLGLDRIRLDDKATYALLQSGETTNVFQLESSGMQSLMKQLKPDCFEDIVALVALYRPGPLGSGMIEDFVAGKRGRAVVKYPHPSLEGILKETFGVMVYQEQVMQAAQEMAGFSLGSADLLRRAMGKKNPTEMARQKVAFVNGAIGKGHAAEDAQRVFDLMDKFAMYGFNKSHSAAYALIAYQCAYLKAHYPVEFLCSTLTADKDKIDKVVRTMAEARALGVTVLPPDVNESEVDFTVVYDHGPRRGAAARPDQPVAMGGRVRDSMNPKIRFGLGAVKGVGAAALEAIFEARSGGAAALPGEEDPNKQPFTDLFDFTSRVDLRRVNKSVIEALVQCGAMDGMHQPTGIGRDRAWAAVEAAVEQGRRMSQSRSTGQTDMFDMLTAPAADTNRPASASFFPRPKETWSRHEQLRREKNTLGFYISGHPLDDYRAESARFCDANTENVRKLKENTRACVAGVIEEYRERTTRNNDRMAFFALDDPGGRLEVLVRPEKLEKLRERIRQIVESDTPVLATGAVKFEREREGFGAGPPEDYGNGGETPASAKLLLDDLCPLMEALRERTRSVRVTLRVEAVNSERLTALRRVLEAHPGSCPVTIELRSSSDHWSVTLGARELLVDPSAAMIFSLEQLFGEKVFELR